MMHEKSAVSSQKVPQKQICRFHLAAGVFISFFGRFAVLGGKSWGERQLGQVDALEILVNKGPQTRGKVIKSYGQNPPPGLQLVEYHPRFLGVDSIYGRTIGKAATKASHALGEADLSETLIALLRGNVLGRLTACAPALVGGGLGGDRGVVDDLVVDGLVRVAKRGVEDGQKAQLSGHNRPWSRSRSPWTRSHCDDVLSLLVMSSFFGSGVQRWAPHRLALEDGTR